MAEEEKGRRKKGVTTLNRRKGRTNDEEVTRERRLTVSQLREGDEDREGKGGRRDILLEGEGREIRNECDRRRSERKGDEERMVLSSSGREVGEIGRDENGPSETLRSLERLQLSEYNRGINDASFFEYFFIELVM